MTKPVIRISLLSFNFHKVTHPKSGISIHLLTSLLNLLASPVYEKKTQNTDPIYKNNLLCILKFVIFKFVILSFNGKYSSLWQGLELTEFSTEPHFETVRYVFTLEGKLFQYLRTTNINFSESNRIYTRS